MLVSSAVLFAKKLFGKGVDLFSHKDEKKENTPQQPEVAPEKKDDNTPEKNITQIPEQPALADPSSVGVEAAHEEQEPELQPHEAAAIEQAKEEEKKMQEE